MKTKAAIFLIGKINEILKNDNHPVNQIEEIYQAITEIKALELGEVVNKYLNFIKRKGD